MLIMNKKASHHLYLGAGTIFLFLLVVFIIIMIATPDLGTKILDALKQIVDVVKS